LNSTFFSKAEIAKTILDLSPPMVRTSILNERAFKEHYALKTEATVNLGAGKISFRRSKFFNAVREVLSGTIESEVKDTEDRAWTIRNEATDDNLPVLVLLSNVQRQILPDFSALSETSSVRLNLLEKAADDVMLPEDAKEKWKNILKERALDEDEIELFHCDIRDTPVHIEQNIRNEITCGQSNISSLVPSSLRYFQRLVGVYDGSRSIRDYATGAGKKLFVQLSEWKLHEGFLSSLYLSSHSALTDELSVNHLEKENLVKVYNFIENHGDILSLLGAFEFGLRILPERPEVKPYLMRLVHKIRDDNPDGEQSEFTLFSALFVLVDGELSRTHLMSDTPPFYRRLASLAQAALIQRQIIQHGIDYNEISQWALSNRGEYFYMQSLADMRNEPRWNPDLASAQQIKADFFGRIMISGNRFGKNIQSEELRELILGNGAQSLLSLSEFPRPYLPGPLEGADDTPNTLPTELAETIEKQLSTEEMEPSSFFGLVNSSLIFNITSEHADLAAEALRLGNYRLVNLEDNKQLLSILSGLATVAAITRNSELSNELRIIVRRYRNDPQFHINIEEAMRICLVAAASLEDLIDWREFAGEWLTELSFSELNGDEGETLHSHLLALLNSVPELWVSCARADAALQAWNSR